MHTSKNLTVNQLLHDWLSNNNNKTFGIIHIAKIYFSAHTEHQHIIFCKYSFKSLGYKDTI